MREKYLLLTTKQEEAIKELNDLEGKLQEAEQLAEKYA